MQCHQCTHGSGHTLAATEIKIHRIQMAQKSTEAAVGSAVLAQPQLPGQHHRHNAFGNIANQCENGRHLAAHPQYVGGTRVE